MLVLKGNGWNLAILGNFCFENINGPFLMNDDELPKDSTLAGKPFFQTKKPEVSTESRC